MTIAGLILDIVGVLMLAFFGVPQPSFEEGVGLGLEDATRLSDGRTVGERTAAVGRKRALYTRMSRGALALIVLGFVLQLIGAT